MFKRLSLALPLGAGHKMALFGVVCTLLVLSQWLILQRFTVVEQRLNHNRQTLQQLDQLQMAFQGLPQTFNSLHDADRLIQQNWSGVLVFTTNQNTDYLNINVQTGNYAELREMITKLHNRGLEVSQLEIEASDLAGNISAQLQLKLAMPR